MKKIYTLFGLLIFSVASSAQYCTSVGPSSTADTNLESATLVGESTTITYTGCPGVTDLEDQTAQSADLIAGNSYSLDITWGTCSSTYYGSAGEVWIDFDGNQVFDPSESIGSDSYSFGGGPLTTTYNFTVPVGASNGTHRMRIMQYEGGTLPLNPCSSFSYGSATDFSISISGGVCAPPSGIMINGQNADSIFFSWTPGGSEPEWEWDYGPIGFTPGSSNATVTDAIPDTITGLASTQFYELYVRSICGAGDTSVWTGPVSFNTYNQGAFMEQNNDCPTAGFIDISSTGVAYDLSDDGEQGITLDFPILYQGLAFTEMTIGNNGGIEFGTLTGSISTGGSVFSANDGLYPWWDDLDSETGDVYYEVQGTSPSRKMIVQWNNSCNYSGSIGDPTVTFQVQVDEATMEIFFVYDDKVFGGAFASDDYAANAEVGVSGPNQDIQVSSDDPTYLTNNSCARFYYTNCPKPTALSDIYVTPDSIVFGWTAGNTETEWQIEWGPTGFTPGNGTTFTTTNLQDTLGGLTQLTEYDIYVTAICDVGDSSAQVGPLTVMTTPVCPGPSNLTVDFALDDSAGISWTNNGTATNWNIQYGPAGFAIGSGTTLTTMDNPDTLYGLNPGMIYDVYVQSDCGGPDTSLWEGPVQVFVPIANDTICGSITIPVDGMSYYYHNIGATATGLGSSSNHTVWFDFVAPSSGSVRLGTCGTPIDTEMELYEADSCNDAGITSLDYADGNPFSSCSGVSPAGIEICGLTPGKTYYFWVGSWSSFDEDQFPVFVEEIIYPEAGTGASVDACDNETAFDLFTTISGNLNTNGQWYIAAPVSGNEITSSIDLTGASGTYDFFYLTENSCLADTAASSVNIVTEPNVGTGSTMDAGCNFGFVNLFDGLSGTIDLGGTWYDGNGTDIGSSSVEFNGEAAGTYDYYYVVDNGVCPADSSTVSVTVQDCAGINKGELITEVYPNPTNGILNIKMSNVDALKSIQLVDVEGRDVTAPKTVNNSQMKFDLSDLSRGVYFLKVTTDTQTKMVRVVKQ